MAMTNIMIDIEALDSNAATAALVSLGAVYFDLEKGTLGEEFYLEVPIQELQGQLNAGRTLSLDTMQWWMQQSDEARKVFTFNNGKEKVTTVGLLHEFSRFCQKTLPEHPKIWGNGVDYDNILLRGLYKAYSIKCPWKYSNNRCYRTMKKMFSFVALDREGTHHNGLDDAKTQAKHLLDIFKYVNKKMSVRG